MLIAYYSVVKLFLRSVDVFVADYGVFKVETKTKTQNGREFTVNGNSNHDTKKFNGSLETKYKWSDYGEY
jgi:hypothetical protein